MQLSSLLIFVCLSFHIYVHFRKPNLNYSIVNVLSASSICRMWNANKLYEDGSLLTEILILPISAHGMESILNHIKVSITIISWSLVFHTVNIQKQPIATLSFCTFRARPTNHLDKRKASVWFKVNQWPCNVPELLP